MMPAKFIPVLLLLCTGYLPDKVKAQTDEVNTALQYETGFIETMTNHLNAVSNRDIAALKATLSPDGELLFILPNREITTTVEDFIHYHEQWFRDTTWTLEAEILHTEVDGNLGIAITEIIYREPDRNGEPYFNRMTVSYALKNMGGEWYVFKDHASSVETSL